MRRVVITGMGILAPNGHGLAEYEQALRTGKSGIRFIPKLEELQFACQVGGIPQNVDELKTKYFEEEDLLAMSEAMIYAGIAAIDCWKDAGLELIPRDEDRVNWDTGAFIGVGGAALDILRNVIPKVDAGKVRRLGSTIVEQTMMSATSAKLSGLLALGNQVSCNSSACTTGTESVIMAYERIKAGMAERMLAGGAENSSEYAWAGFDAMKVTNRDHNQEPEKASRPMSASAAGFIPGSGAGLLMLESLESAQKRGARIYAEVVGGALNCGGHRMGGSMTAPNPVSVRNCIKLVLDSAKVDPGEIDLLNGHLTATFADPHEINSWSTALGRGPGQFPLVQSTKSLVGHALGAAGGLECVAAVLQVYRGFAHGSLNCEDLHEQIKPFEKSVVRQTRDVEIGLLAKASFGFGDVNGVVLFKKYSG